MKPQELADLLNVTTVTLRRWAREEFREFLSPNAQGGNSLHRSFDDRDIRILAWVAKMRMQNIPSASIRETLRSAEGNNWRDLPPLPDGLDDMPVPVMPIDTAVAKLDAAHERYDLTVQALTRERDELRERLIKAESRNTDLEQKLMAVTEQLLDLNRELTSLLKRGQKRGR